MLKRIVSLLTAFLFFGTAVGAETSLLPGEETYLLPQETDSDYALEVQIPVDQFYPGDEIYVCYSLSDIKSVYGMELCFSYDDDIFSYQSIETFADNKKNPVNILQQEPGKILLACSVTGEEAGADTEHLCTLTLTAKKAGSGNIILSSAKIVQNDLTWQNFIDINICTSITVKDYPQEITPSPGGGGGSRPSGSGSVRPSGGGSITVPSGTTTTAEKPVPTEIPEIETDLQKDLIFSDLTSFEWAEEAIVSLCDKGIVSGYEDGNFRPAQPITRAEAVKLILLSLSMEKYDEKEISFTDVKKDDWYYTYITKAAALGIIHGYTDGKCAPENQITREEFAAMLMRSINVKGYNLTPKRLNINFSDEEEISDYAVGYIDFLYTAEIMSGDTDGRFRPKDPLGRAEAAVSLFRLLSAEANADAEESTEENQV
ncbi:S-layer homology domain-containing protein [Ructibacterium gallinarum]|uniref:S-layer homology domain-containing protein n=1 Tax=Ructibacterium gallinarum TaxID=2779355 RepID=A0A9D5M308_9FIRM|nr:S-layer homology domain-containing protein [Ructibacterium gallinarum]MBE5039680.1 S-layer homology domain-containing protein [Ructibacterium gallinarum]